MSKLKEKLESLYRLAKLTDDEIKLLDENKLGDARLNEVRTASFLLLHTARTKGVRIKFIFDDVKPSKTENSAPKHPPPPYAPSPYAPPPYAKWKGPPGTGNADDFFRDFDYMMREIDRREAREKSQREAREKSQREARERAERERLQKEVESKFQRPQSRPYRPASDSSRTPLIQSQYDGVCLACGKPYKKDEQVWWVRNVGCSHFVCGSEVLQQVAAGG